MVSIMTRATWVRELTRGAQALARPGVSPVSACLAEKKTELTRALCRRFAGDEAFPGTGSLTQVDDPKL